MTRPAREPSPTQRQSEGAFAVRQLQRRPAFPMAYAYLNDLELAVGVSRTVSWSTFVTSDQQVFATAATNGGVEANTAGNQYLMVKKEGLYHLSATGRWVTPVAGAAIDITSYTLSPLDDYTATLENTLGYADAAHTNLTGSAKVGSWFAFNVDEGPGYFTIELLSSAGSDVEVDLAVMWWPAHDRISIF